MINPCSFFFFNQILYSILVQKSEKLFQSNNGHDRVKLCYEVSTGVNVAVRKLPYLSYCNLKHANRAPARELLLETVITAMPI